ncbi:NAD(P)H-binding protein, partial [Candidatus Thioglobus sp.]|nr:NAD(P)H-binding protein [Candidatus Thioglobus sp.]
MLNKHLIFGATGAIGSSLAQQLKKSGQDAHLVARNEDELKSISENLGFTFTVADVLEDGFIDKIKSDTSEFDISGLAYCIGSIDLKPLKRVTESDLHQCM